MKNGSFTFTCQQKSDESATFGHNKKVKKNAETGAISPSHDALYPSSCNFNGK